LTSFSIRQIDISNADSEISNLNTTIITLRLQGSKDNFQLNIFRATLKEKRLAAMEPIMAEMFAKIVTDQARPKNA